MRKILAVLALALCGLLAGSAFASDGFDDLAKIVKSGASNDVLLAYINASPTAYDLSVDEILYLNDLGVDASIIKAIKQHGDDVRAGVALNAAPAPDNGAVTPVMGTPPPDVDAPPVEPAPATAGPESDEIIDTAPVVTAPPEGDVTVSTFYDT